MYLRGLKGYEKALNIKYISILDIVNRSEDGRSSKSCVFKSFNLPQNKAPLQNIRLLQKLSFKEITAFYLSRSSRGLQDILINRPEEMNSLKNIEKWSLPSLTISD
jgi:hypothetical protein